MQELIVTGQALPAVPQSAWGNEGTSTQDLVIPRITLQHDLSPAVKDQKCRAGEFMNSVTGLVMDKPIEFIPITSYLEWEVLDNTNPKASKKERLSKVLIDKRNENLRPGEQFENGKAILRLRVLNFLVLMPNDLEGLPVLLTFKKSGLYAGKVLSTHFQTSTMKGLPGARATFKLGSEQRRTNGNEYWAPTVSPGRPTTEQELAAAYLWYQTWSKQAVKVDEENKPADEAVPF